MYGADQSLLGAAVTNYRARRVDARRQCGIRDDPTTPYRLYQIILADDALAIADQINQEVEDLRRDRNRHPASAQFPPIAIERVIAKDERHVRISPDAGRTPNLCPRSKRMVRKKEAPRKVFCCDESDSLHSGRQCRTALSAMRACGLGSMPSRYGGFGPCF